MLIPRPFDNWLKRLRVKKQDRIRLPWWGSLLHSTNKAILEQLIQSGLRISETLSTPGWKDVESVIQDWLDRYSDQAGRLGQKMEEKNGQLVLMEEDTANDDRKRLIACAQAAALRGLLSEIKQRAKAVEMLQKRDKEKEIEELTGELV